MWIIFFKKNTIYVIFLSKYGMIKRRKKGDFVEIYCPDRDVEYFSVVYDDANIIVVNKAFGIIVAEKDKTRQHELSLQELVQKKCKKPVFALHRIDMNARSSPI